MVSQTTTYLQALRQDQPIAAATRVNCSVPDAVAAQASDIHIEPWQSTPVAIDQF